MNEKENPNILGYVHAPSVIAILSLIAVIWAMLASFKSDMRLEMDRNKEAILIEIRKLDNKINSLSKR